MAATPLEDILELGGAGLWVGEAGEGAETAPGVVRLGVHHGGAFPDKGLEDFDILLTIDPDAPRPWVVAADLEAVIAEVRGAVERQPTAAAVAAQMLRVSLTLTFEQALVSESLAYSMLLGGGAFKAWRARNPPRPRPAPSAPRVRWERQADALHVRLVRPEARNAVDAAMRDELHEALELALLDPDSPAVILSGEGPAFSAGGDLDEFGQASDRSLAHLIRTLRSPVALIHRLGPRITARLHGACIGAGIEMPAAAGRVVSRPGAFFRLPEVAMGLIPGAGGTASIPRRIGRHRACWLAITGRDLDLPTALAWGLVDAVEGEA